MDARRRRWLDLALLVSLALAVRVLTAWPMQRPGYMDAAYYIDGALSLYQKRGFSLPVIWNYIEEPAGIPHPSHLYWMPLSSILAYLSFLVFGPSYRAAQVPFGLLSSLLPALSYLVAHDLAQERRHALLAGLLALLGGFYTAYWVTPDAFAPFAVAGALCLWALGRGLERGRAAWYALGGACAGLAHLARADGVLLVVVALCLGIWEIALRSAQSGRKEGIRRALWRVSLFAGAYLLVMAPWFVRNWAVAGSPLAGASARTMWLTDYDDLYSYGKPLTLRAYAAWGWGNILLSKVQALWLNAQTLLVVGWMIFLAPIGLVGAWRLRGRTLYQPAFLYGALLYAVMSLVFTLPGWRGGMLHSTVALLPTLYVAAIEGLDASVAWVATRRQSWRVDQARRVLGGGLVVLSVLLGTWLYFQGVDRFRGEHLYVPAAAWMRGNLDLKEQDEYSTRVMVNDAASFYYYSRLPSLSIPNADLDTVLAVMDRFDVDYLLLDGNYAPLQAIYQAPSSDGRLVLLASFGEGPETLYLLRLRRDAD